jgi:hypothetical protein
VRLCSAAQDRIVTARAHASGRIFLHGTFFRARGRKLEAKNELQMSKKDAFFDLSQSQAKQQV